MEERLLLSMLVALIISVWITMKIRRWGILNGRSEYVWRSLSAIPGSVIMTTAMLWGLEWPFAVLTEVLCVLGCLGCAIVYQLLMAWASTLEKKLATEKPQNGL